MTEIEEKEETSVEPEGFFTSILKIQCMRSSLLSGFPAGAVGAIAALLYKTNGQVATNVAFASFWIVATFNWCMCRHKTLQRQKELEELKKAMGDPKKIPLTKEGYRVPRGMVPEESETKESENES